MPPCRAAADLVAGTGVVSEPEQVARVVAVVERDQPGVGPPRFPDSRHFLHSDGAHDRSTCPRTPGIPSKICLATTLRSRTPAGGSGGTSARSKPASSMPPPFQSPGRRRPDHLLWSPGATRASETPRPGASRRVCNWRGGADRGCSQYRLDNRGSQQRWGSWGDPLDRYFEYEVCDRDVAAEHTQVRLTGWSCWRDGCSGWRGRRCPGRSAPASRSSPRWDA